MPAHLSDIPWGEYHKSVDMAEDDDLYGDLEEEVNTAQAQLLQDRLKKCMKKNETLTGEIQEYKAQLASLLSEKAQVEKNMITLFNTAQREIERKDKEIVDLRISVDSLRREISHR